MGNVYQVAEYILNKLGSITAMKLQKLVYYSQAWHLAWTEKALFSAKIEAWRDGPVVPSLYKIHKGHFKLQPGFFKKELKSKMNGRLDAKEKDVINRVIKYYGKRDPHWLSQLTHLEDPWKNARLRGGVENQENSTEEITHQEIFEYYSSL